jgi:hypothetical protein
MHDSLRDNDSAKMNGFLKKGIKKGKVPMVSARAKHG